MLPFSTQSVTSTQPLKPQQVFGASTQISPLGHCCSPHWTTGGMSSPPVEELPLLVLLLVPLLLLVALLPSLPLLLADPLVSAVELVVSALSSFGLLDPHAMTANAASSGVAHRNKDAIFVQ